MDLMLLRIFQGEVARQCEIVLIAVADLNRSLVMAEQTEVWMAVQTLLVAAANISKLCWGQKGRKLAERADLRASLGIADDSILQFTKFRNHFEHFDERLDEWWRDSPRHNFINDIIAPITMTITNDPTMFTQKDAFRWLDQGTGRVIFWGEEYSISAVVEEVRRILPVARTEAGRPHWKPPSSSTTGGGQ